MYTLSSLKLAVKKPYLVARELNRLYYTQLNQYNSNPKGEPIFEKDWDNLIILDACRADIFRNLVSIPGETETRTSLGGATYEFVPTNFEGKKLYDTVYVTANGWYTKLKDGIESDVHALVTINPEKLPDDSIDPDFGIPHPEAVTDHAIQAAEKYPNKRLIIHHNQPHYPYIGDFGRSIFRTSSSSLRDAVETREESTTCAELKQAYRENLKLVLQEVEALLEHLVGKTVITSDHGEMLGERHKFLPLRDYGHFDQIYNKEITEVPWHIIPYTDRKTVISELPDKEGPSEVDVEENLRNLGYL